MPVLRIFRTRQPQAALGKAAASYVHQEGSHYPSLAPVLLGLGYGQPQRPQPTSWPCSRTVRVKGSTGLTVGRDYHYRHLLYHLVEAIQERGDSIGLGQA